MLGHCAFVARLDLALRGIAECWTNKVLACLMRLGAEPLAGLHGDDLTPPYSCREEYSYGICHAFECTIEFSGDYFKDPRAFHIGADGIKACRYRSWMGTVPDGGARFEWLPHAKAAMPYRLH